ncbi:MAG: tetratricopeptide repeat protein [Desulfobacterales bacterium]|jgi:tetratricopeptide (TPR) repeat protein|nr:hypothetical protein [Desulfobacter sp.]MDP6395392.1 tetratricopeptide repeat protein [Desulfobacterales bacterium]MDP6681917.1 tetratricopeptide repeat protein [Desulfobacterales bacterium]MDP6808373.1 tetratricopeptide repeat protein [Desulfobacterales bacterium]|tara:strand:+ start:13931 stop:14614 length:684 start_codon:yes stop_codon:yes gene_type:complete
MVKKISRKRLLKEPDEFITFTGNFFQFAKKHRVKLVWSCGGIVSLILIFLGMQFFSTRAEKKAATILEQTMSRYEMILKENDLSKAYRDLGKDFEQILKRYSKTGAGKIATVIYANMSYKADEVDKAITLYGKALQYFSDTPSLKSIILNGLAHSYQKKKDYEHAIEYFKMIASEPGSTMKDEALFNLGQIYGEKGDMEQKRKVFQQIISDHSDSIYIEMVNEGMSG